MQGWLCVTVARPLNFFPTSEVEAITDFFHISSRCSSCSVALVHGRRLLVGKNDTQSVYTGKQQREAVSTLPFIVPGLFRAMSALFSTSEAPVRDSSADVPTDGRPDLAAAAIRRGGGMAEAGTEDPDESASGYEADSEDDGVAVKKGSQFDWDAYNRVWQGTPTDVAVTHLFAEYAVLYSRICRQVRSSAPPPLTLSEGTSIAEQAQRFITTYVTSILGQVHSSKVHRLLCHVIDAIRDHGNISLNCNTAPNEAIHKEDKAYYSRTNKSTADFTRQVVLQSQGAGEVLARLDREEAGDAPVADSPTTATGAREAAQGIGEEPRAPADATQTAGGYKLERLRASDLEQRCGVSNVARLLDVEQDDLVALVSTVRIDAVFDCGLRSPQLVRATPSYRDEPWFDSILYRVGEQTRVGEIRAIVRRHGGDVAVVRRMIAVHAQPGCPLTARGCQRLAWDMPPDGASAAVDLVPVSALRRLVHVVPDFLDLVRRRGLDAAPPGSRDHSAQHAAMRFFINDFYSW